MNARGPMLRAAFWIFLFGLPFQLVADDLHRRVGFYQWAGPLVESGEPDSLTAARERTVAIGAKVFRLYVGARFDYVHRPFSARRFKSDSIAGPLTPAKIVNLPRYRAVLEDSRLETVILTVYPIYDYGAGPDDINFTRPWGEREREVEFSQTKELCDYLYRNFGQFEKTIILANTEADNKLLDIMNHTDSPELAIQNLRAWTRTRFEAVDQARRVNSSARLKIFHAFEISLVNLRIVKQGSMYRKVPRVPKGERSWNALSDVVPGTLFDLLSYSAYEATNSPYETQKIDVNPSLTRERLQRDVHLIRQRAGSSISSAGRRRFGESFVMIGELGYPRERFELLSTGGVLPRLRSALAAAQAEDCPYIVLWQVFDNPRNGGEAWGFGMIDRLGHAPRLRAEKSSCNSIASCISNLLSDAESWPEQ